jgi:hypothetical protein
VQLPADIETQTGAITNVQLTCRDPLIRDPVFACEALTLRAQPARWPLLTLQGKAQYHSRRGTLEASGGGMQIAGAPLTFELHAATTGNWNAQVELSAIELPQLRTWLEPYVALPKQVTVSGQGRLTATLAQQGESLLASADLAIENAGFQNEAYTWIGEKLALSVRASADVARTPLTFDLSVSGRRGQALAGAVLLDFDRNPLDLTLRGALNGNALQIHQLTSQQQDLAQVTATADISLDPLTIRAAQINADHIAFPAAYSSYLQLPLATTPFNQLVTSGSATASITVRDNLPVSLDLLLHDLAFGDAAQSLQVTGVNSALHWHADRNTTAQPSWLTWENSRGWGVVGNRARLDFETRARDLRLLQPARLPFFDGALLINTLAVQDAGLDGMAGEFDAVIEPISVAPIARALGWPVMSGTLAGRIPGLTYRNKLLTLQGNFEANVFDGRVVAANLRVREPLGAWPRLYGDITARNLDLDLITRTFEFGSITGRLDFDMLGLETFNWSPVAFDLQMATPARDRSKHRISQRAVQNLSDIGGGGGGVAAALQSGALKFFDDFGYDRIGLACRLRNDVCQMNGVGNVDGGFYIVKGKGLPRIDIIGNNRRVDWLQLLTQVRDAAANPQGISVQ